MVGQQNDRPEDQGPDQGLSLTEWVTLALLSEGPNHGFALAKELAPGTDLGRVLTVRKPLVYRALDRCRQRALVMPYQTEPGDAGPTRTVHQITGTGASLVDRWLEQPVRHIRDVRVEFLLKLRLLERRDRSPTFLIGAQRQALAQTIDGLTDRPEAPGADVVDRWRAENARAVNRFLHDLRRHAN